MGQACTLGHETKEGGGGGMSEEVHHHTSEKLATVLESQKFNQPTV